jgi:hypothetical protein
MTDDAAAGGPVPLIKPRDGIDDDLVEIGQRYWHLDGFDSETGRPIWSETASKIDCSRWGQGSGRAYIVAAAAVRAVLPGHACPQCGEELVLASRSALDKIIQGEQPDNCADCDASLQEKIARALDPTRLRRARENHDRQAGRQRERWRRQDWDAQRAGIVAEAYAVSWLDNQPIPAASVRVELIALALLSYAPSPAPLGPIREWVDPLHPDASSQHNCVAEVLNADLIRFHPSSQVDGFVWEPVTFDDALAVAGEGGEMPAPTLTGSYFPLKATYFTQFGHSLETAAAAVRGHLAARLDPATMSLSRQQALVEMAVELLAEEAIRYFEYLLDQHKLPGVQENHRDKLVEAAYAAARVRPLSELYNLAWRAARDAAAAAQRHPQAARANMTAHGVNRFESNAQRALDPAFDIKPYSSVAGLELAAMTRTLFLRILHLDVFATGVPDIEANLPNPIAGAPQREGPMGASPESEFGQLSCTECGFPVQQQDAWLWVEVREALDYVEAMRAASESGDLIQALIDLSPARWRVSHTECSSDSGAVCEARMPATYREFLSWTAIILNEREKWIHGSDFADLLAEVAGATGRFGVAGQS